MKERMRYMAYGGPWPIGHRCSLNLSHQATGISWHTDHEFKVLHGKKGEKKGETGGNIPSKGVRGHGGYRKLERK